MEYVKRGKRVTDTQLRWRSRCGNYAVSQSAPACLRPCWYALYRQGSQWLSVVMVQGRPKRYRTRLAAEVACENHAARNR